VLREKNVPPVLFIKKVFPDSQCSKLRAKVYLSRWSQFQADEID